MRAPEGARFFAQAKDARPPPAAELPLGSLLWEDVCNGNLKR